MPTLLPLTTVAAECGVSARWLQKLAATGRIPAERIGRAWLVAPADVPTIQAILVTLTVGRPSKA